MLGALKLAAAALWLPLATEVVWALRTGSAPTPAELVDAGDVLAFTWLGAIPLSLAVPLLWKHSRLVACVYAVVLGSLTIALLGGGLSRPLPTSIGFAVITFRLLPDPSMYGDIQNVVLSLHNLVASLADGLRIWFYALVVSVPAWTALVFVARAPFQWDSPVTWAAALRVLRLIAIPLWLSLALLALTFTHLGSPQNEPQVMSIIRLFAPLYVFAWLAAHPLSLGIFLLHGRSRALAYVLGVTLGALTIALAPAWSPAGPLGVMLFATVVALPAWLALTTLAFLNRSQTAQGASARA